MIRKSEIMERICAIEEKLDHLMLDAIKLDKRVKKLEPKKEKKGEAKK